MTETSTTSNTTCTGRNGTYGCKLTTGHDGKHMTPFRSAGKSRIAEWTDPWSELATFDPVTGR